ncbi:MAG: hypothetical protein KJT03_07015, partial [Verrucomicrobiae bacterium]|nr:hypothetical protein [Verrucomicrobiae bacterium]
AKAIIDERIGLRPDRVLISATHTHAAPRSLPGLTGNALNEQYHDFLARRIADAVERAIGHLAPAQVGWTSFEKPEYVHNRRWFMKPDVDMTNPFGETGDQVRMNARGDGLVKPAGPVDPELFVLSVQHLNGRPLALMANYGTHYVGGYERGNVSADYFGLLSEILAERLMADWETPEDAVEDFPPFVAMVSNGTSGDVRISDLSKNGKSYQPFELIGEVGRSIAYDIHAQYPKIRYQENLRLAMTQKELLLGVRKPGPERVAWARKVLAEWDGTKPRQTMNAVTYSQEALALAEYPDEKPIILQAIRIGDLAIASSPCETFAETGLAIKKRSPFENTFTIELANGAEGYLPTFEQHRLGGYETWPARSSFLEVTAERKIRETLIEMLKSLDVGR